MAGVARFERTNDGVKVRCLTAWLHPKVAFEPGRMTRLMSNGVDSGTRTHDLQSHNLAF